MFGSAFGWDNVFNAISQERQMDRDADAADTSWRRGQENMRLSNDFTERMANTANQRAVVDLRSAGLNPILAATKGVGGSGAGSGAMTSAPSQAPAPDFSKSFGPTIALARAQTDNAEMDTRKKDAERNLASQMYNESQARTGLINQQFHTEKESTRVRGHEANSAGEIEKHNKLEGSINETEWAKFWRYIDRIRGGTGAYRDIK